MIRILKNKTDADISIQYGNITQVVLANSQEDLALVFQAWQLANIDSLVEYLGQGVDNFQLNDGVLDLGQVAAIDLIRGYSQNVNIKTASDDAKVKVNVVEENSPTSETFQLRQLLFDVPAESGVHIFDYSWPYQVTVKMAQVFAPEAAIGDSVKCCVAPDTIIGTITEDVAAEDTEISVSETVIQNVYKGVQIKLYDGVNQDDMNRIIDINENILTMETAVTHSFSTATPTYVQMTVWYVLDFEFIVSGRFEMGSNCVKGFCLPANAIMRVFYNNVSGTAKKAAAFVEYYY